MIVRMLREAGIIIIFAMIFGFGYTFLSKKGYFAPEQPPPNIQMSTLAEAKLGFDARAALFIDSRNSFEYKLGHIPGALSIPLKDFDLHRQQIQTISRDQLVFVYCDGAECNSSIEVGVKLSGLGFKQIKVLFGGWQEWKANDFPIEK